MAEETKEGIIREHHGGTLLEQARQLVDETQKPYIKTVDIGGGESALVELKHGDAVAVLEPPLFDAWRAKPLFVAGNPKLTDIGSLISYTNRHKDVGSVLFANDDRSAPSITAVLDYHMEGPAGDGGQRFGRHQAIFPVPLSDEWQAWNKADGETLTMPQFARFLEDHIIDVMAPGEVLLGDDQARFVESLGGIRRVADPAKLMELATGMQVFEQGEVTQATRIQTGESQITVKSEHVDAAGAQLIVPSMFVIAIPVFKGGEPYQVLVRLRYRRTNQGIVFFYELWRVDRVFDHAFTEAVTRAADETSLPVFRGRR